MNLNVMIFNSQGVKINQENVLITTHPLVVKGYMSEFKKLWKYYEEEFEPLRYE